MIEPKIFSVGQINRYIKNQLENDYILKSLLVRGEISNLKAHSSGHLYFTLKDAEASISCVMFAQDAAILPFELENGMSLVAYGRVSLYEKTGQYQIYVEMVEPLGVGALQIAFAQMKERLQQEGLFDSEFKREVPRYISTIAIVTSPTGAAVRDMIQIIRRRDSRVKIAVFPVLVQGEYAATDIAEGIKLANLWGEADLIIVGRGGGSAEDLWAFNEERVARAIFASEVPVISAVGHETDFTISDFVADLRAPTPSAAAELATVLLLEERAIQFDLESRLYRGMKRIIGEKRKMLDFLAGTAALRRPLVRVERLRKQLFAQMEKLDKEAQRRLGYAVQRMAMAEIRLESASPLTIMGRGYLAAMDENEAPVVSVKQLEVNDILNIQMKDGKLQTKVIKKAVLPYGEEKTNI